MSEVLNKNVHLSSIACQSYLVEVHLTSISLLNSDCWNTSKNLISDQVLYMVYQYCLTTIYLHLNRLTIDELTTTDNTLEHNSNLLTGVENNVIDLIMRVIDVTI